MTYIPYLMNKLDLIFQSNHSQIKNKKALLDRMGLHRNAFNKWSELDKLDREQQADIQMGYIPEKYLPILCKVLAIPETVILLPDLNQFRIWFHHNPEQCWENLCRLATYSDKFTLSPDTRGINGLEGARTVIIRKAVRQNSNGIRLRAGTPVRFDMSARNGTSVIILVKGDFFQCLYPIEPGDRKLISNNSSLTIPPSGEQLTVDHGFADGSSVLAVFKDGQWDEQLYKCLNQIETLPIAIDHIESYLTNSPHNGQPNPSWSVHRRDFYVIS